MTDSNSPLAKAQVPQAQNPDFPSMQKWCTALPLYDEHLLGTKEENRAYDFRYFNGVIDSYCPGCRRDSTFKCENPGDFDFSMLGLKIFEHRFYCVRDSKHWLSFTFKMLGRAVSKIGQFPPLAELDRPDLAKYSKILGPNRYLEFKKGVGLASHGVGIGSFIYLRRVVESLIEDAHVLASKDAGWNEDSYRDLRMGERIGLLHSHLPEFLVDNRALYAILSRGVHDLSEEDCLAAFEIMFVAIELILDEKLESAIKAEKIKNASTAISKIKGQLRQG